jgi:hypothetical protein
MARRADPARIHAARRMAVRNGLTDYGMAEQTAEAWVDAWEDEADRQGLDRRSPAYWDGAAPWIAEQRKTRKLPE